MEKFCWSSCFIISTYVSLSGPQVFIKFRVTNSDLVFLAFIFSLGKICPATEVANHRQNSHNTKCSHLEGPDQFRDPQYWFFTKVSELKYLKLHTNEPRGTRNRTPNPSGRRLIVLNKEVVHHQNTFNKSAPHRKRDVKSLYLVSWSLTVNQFWTVRIRNWTLD